MAASTVDHLVDLWEKKMAELRDIWRAASMAA